jgi:hypothetical protein
MAEEMHHLYGVNLLIALLTRFPELDEVKYNGEAGELSLSIDVRLQGEVESLFEQFRGGHQGILQAYSQLESVFPLQTNIEILSLSSGWWKISIYLPIKNCQLSLFSLLISWWKNFFLGNEFSSNRPLERLGEDESGFQEEMIENMLQFLQNEKLLVTLRGVRDNHQIVVFQKK